MWCGAEIMPNRTPGTPGRRPPPAHDCPAKRANEWGDRTNPITRPYWPAPLAGATTFGAQWMTAGRAVGSHGPNGRGNPLRVSIEAVWSRPGDEARGRQGWLGTRNGQMRVAGGLASGRSYSQSNWRESRWPRTPQTRRKSWEWAAKAWAHGVGAAARAQHGRSVGRA